MKITITSFGYLHGPAPEVDFLIDARRIFRDPHIDPAFRQLNGYDPKVVDRVLQTPGVRSVAANMASTLYSLAYETQIEAVTVGVGCAGGRHRSVVIANQILIDLTGFEIPVFILRHRDISKEVVVR